MKIKLDSPSREELLGRSLTIPSETRHTPAAEASGSGDQPPTDDEVSTAETPDEREAAPTSEASADLMVDTWAMSPERDAFRERRLALLFILGTAVVLTAVAWGMLKPPEEDGSQWWARLLLVLAGGLLVVAMAPYWSSRRAFRQRRLATAATRVDRAIQRLAEPDASGDIRVRQADP